MSLMFNLVGGGIGVMPDPEDNPDNHLVPHHEAGTRISFEVLNVGDIVGNAKVGVKMDDTFVPDWQSQSLDPSQGEVGYVRLGRLTPGTHRVLVYVNPGSGQLDHNENTFDVE